MFNENHRKEPDAKHYKIIGIGVDYGQQNATTYQAAGININKRRLEGLESFSIPEEILVNRKVRLIMQKRC